MRLLSSVGQRIQYSVFECDLTNEALAGLEIKIAEAINRRTDRVNFYPVCAACFNRAREVGAPCQPRPDW